MKYIFIDMKYDNFVSEQFQFLCNLKMMILEKVVKINQIRDLIKLESRELENLT